MDISSRHNEALILAEAEKQQALCMKETEKNALQEKLNATTRDLHEKEIDYEKLRREALSKQEQDRVR